jgi:hypothetical protein
LFHLRQISWFSEFTKKYIKKSKIKISLQQNSLMSRNCKFGDTCNQLTDWQTDGMTGWLTDWQVNYVTNITEQNSFLGSYRLPGSQEIPFITRNWRLCYHIHKGLSLAHAWARRLWFILSPSFFCEIHCTVILPSLPVSVLQVSLPKAYMHLSSSPLCHITYLFFPPLACNLGNLFLKILGVCERPSFIPIWKKRKIISVYLYNTSNTTKTYIILLKATCFNFRKSSSGLS